MQRIPIASTALASIGYDAETQRMQVEFKDGRVYEYLDVPEYVHTNWMMAPSKGQHFNVAIRGHLRYRVCNAGEAR